MKYEYRYTHTPTTPLLNKYIKSDFKFSPWTGASKYNYIFEPFFWLNVKYDSISQLTTTSQLIQYKFNVFNMLKHRRRRSISPFFIELIDNSENIFDEYRKLRKSSFTHFFSDYNVDSPLCFLGSNSIRRHNFEFPLLKFMNFLMTAGKREKVFISFLQTFHKIFEIIKRNLILFNDSNTHWLSIYNLTNTVFFQSNTHKIFKSNININTSYSHFFYNRKKYFSEKSYFTNLLWQIMKVIKPLFAFSVYSVDKNVRKFAKGRTNKYVFIWKYIPAYKRDLKILRLVAKDIKFNSGPTFSGRILNSLQSLRTDYKSNFVWQISKFSHNYVFKNLKKTLLINQRTTS